MIKCIFYQPKTYMQVHKVLRELEEQKDKFGLVCASSLKNAVDVYRSLISYIVVAIVFFPL